MDRISKLLDYINEMGADSFLQHALALEYIKVGKDEEARVLFNTILKREPTYIGSYYHLGKLLERAGDFDRAIRVYVRGMEEAKSADDMHAYNELQGAGATSGSCVNRNGEAARGLRFHQTSWGQEDLHDLLP